MSLRPLKTNVRPVLIAFHTTSSLIYQEEPSARAPQLAKQYKLVLSAHNPSQNIYGHHYLPAAGFGTDIL